MATRESELASILVWAAGTSRDRVRTEGLVTPIEGLRAMETMAQLSSVKRRMVERLLSRASSVGEKAVILKTIAVHAHATGFEADIRAFADTIRGMPLQTLVERTTAYGIAAKGGLKQTYRMSCGPSVRLLTEALADPPLAMRIKSEPWGPVTTTAGTRERQVLEAAGGIAIPRSDAEATALGLSGKGKGSRVSKYMDDAGAHLGLHYEETNFANAPDRKALLDVVAERVRLGMHTPARLVLGDEGHYVLVVDSTRNGVNQRLWRVHDVWNGSTYRRTDNQLLNEPFHDGKLFTHFLVPNFLEG